MNSRVCLTSSLWMLLACPLAYGNAHDTYGVGAAAIGMGNAQTAAATGGAAAYYNPAALARSKGIRMDVGFQTFLPNFPTYTGIVYDRNQNGLIDEEADGTPESTSVVNQYTPSSGIGLTAAIPIGSFLAAGVSAYIPAQHLMRLQFNDPYVPYYPLYKNRTQRFTVYTGLGIRVFDGLYIGAGTSVSARAVISARVTSAVQVVAGETDENGEAEPTQIIVNANIEDVSVGLKPDSAPTASILLNFGWLADPLKGLNIGAVYRGESSVKSDAHVVANAYGEIVVAGEEVYTGPLTTDPIEVLAEDVTSAFNPMNISAGISYTWKEKLTVDADATYTAWSDYHDDILGIPTQTIDINGLAVVTIRGGREIEGDPGTLWKDTVSPRVGIEYSTAMPFGGDMGFKVTVRGGYGYHPSPVPLQIGRVNMLDSNKHIFSGGLGFDVPIPSLTHPLKVDLFTSFHKLEEREHVKAEGVGPDVNGEYPAGYPLEGRIVSSGSILGFGGSAGLTF